ncbi:hypothetical protein IWW50_001637 [Coemansia erecta]|nr:hypothetical protein IWW50_001637 [Coemansia erecta]
MADPAIDTQRAAFWQTLLAMGFDPASAASGTYSGVTLDARVFEHGIYHMKAAELILHFLFSHLDSVRFKREFFDSWPIGDSRQARDFRAHAFKWLDELRRESVEREDGRWPLDVPVRRSFVDECKGLRFEQVLWALATFVAHRLLRKGGAWAKHIKHPLIEIHGPVGKSESDAVSAALESCRARYARRTRDRLLAQQSWQRTEQALIQQIDRADERQQQAHHEFRMSRKRIGSEVPDIDAIPDVDASAEEIEQALDRVAGEAARLWEDSAGWVERNRGVIEIVEAVLENRANSVRLDGRKHVRLAPPPQLASQWTQWLAKRHATPFRAANVDLQVLTRMASACVGALRRDIASAGSDSSTLVLEDTDSSTMPRLLENSDEQVQGLDRAIAEQDVRIGKLKRLRAQLTDQHASVSQLVSSEQHDSVTSVDRLISIVAEPIRNPTHGLAGCGSAAAGQMMTERVQQLADVWDDLIAEEYPQHIVDSALKGTAVSSTPLSVGLSGMSFFSDRRVSSLPARKEEDQSPITRITGEMSTLTCAKKRPYGDDGDRESTKKRRETADDDVDMLVDEDVPDFLVD